MRVLSLFDGISCARVALGDRVTEYFASEVDKHAIDVATKNYPDTRHIGDVRSVKGEDYAGIDLLIGGSPCVDLSIAKKDRQGLAGERSKLFWEYVRILREAKPRWFVLENVASMPKADRDVITHELGVEPVMIDAALVSAQSRKRLFWTNIPVTQPADRGILLRDILQPDAEVDESMTVKGTLVPSAGGSTKLGHIGTSDAQANRVYSVDGKSATLSANGGGLGAKTGLYATGAAIRGNTRTETPEGTTYSDKLDIRQDNKANALTPTFSNKLALVANESRIRKLTPVECERLQGLPDGYTEGISKTQRYKCLGNAFNVEVMRHILSGLR